MSDNPSDPAGPPYTDYSEIFPFMAQYDLITYIEEVERPEGRVSLATRIWEFFLGPKTPPKLRQNRT
jgi:hypothetical protein